MIVNDKNVTVIGYDTSKYLIYSYFVSKVYFIHLVSDNEYLYVIYLMFFRFMLLTAVSNNRT